MRVPFGLQLRGTGTALIVAAAVSAAAALMSGAAGAQGAAGPGPDPKVTLPQFAQRHEQPVVTVAALAADFGRR